MQGLKFRGRPPVKIAESVKSVVHGDDYYADGIRDRRYMITDDFVGAVIAQSIFTWEGRNPAPALDPDGNFQGTDLDLLSFMVPMAAREAVIEIPRYRNRRKVVVRANERKIGTDQFGKITGLTSHQRVFSFSVRILDQTIVTRYEGQDEERMGAHRNYMLVDCDGHWYHGWDKIVWDPTVAENQFLTEQGLWTGHTVYFKHYVHPARWQSIFGAPYLLLKMLMARIDEEAAFFRAEMKRLEAKGITLPEGTKKPYVPAEYEGATRPIEVETMEVILDLPSFTHSYHQAPETQDGMVWAYKLQKFLTWTLKPRIQFVARADEAAYFKYGKGQIANWMTGRKWNTGWKPPRGVASWNQMVLSNDAALRYRIKKVTEQVSAG